eukprot:891700-Pyramimonas_sp.AAC.1
MPRLSSSLLSTTRASDLAAPRGKNYTVDVAPVPMCTVGAYDKKSCCKTCRGLVSSIVAHPEVPKGFCGFPGPSRR